MEISVKLNILVRCVCGKEGRKEWIHPPHPHSAGSLVDTGDALLGQWMDVSFFLFYGHKMKHTYLYLLC